MNRRMKRLVTAAVLLAMAWVAQEAGVDLGTLTDWPASRSTPASSSAPSDRSRSAGNARIEEALSRQESGFMITLDARVTRTLPDDDEGARHQRFLMELDTGRSILVAHNIDLADRVPVRTGDALRVHGQFEWNDKGGVIHWTHRDPAGRHEGGWIEHRGTRVE